MASQFKKIALILLMIVSSILTLCGGCGFKQEVEITPRYFVVQVDIADDRDVCYKLNNGDYIGLLGGGLSRVYHKADTLIAIKLIRKGQTAIKEHYIIPLYNDILDPGIGIEGPLTEAELKIELNKKGVEVSQFAEVDIN